MSGILIHTQQKGRLRQSVALCIHMHTHSTAPHSFAALSCDSWEQCQSKSRSAAHVFHTSDRQYLISCWLRLPVKLLWQGIEPKIGFFMVVMHSHEGTYSTYGEIFYHGTGASFSRVHINCSRDNLKDKRKNRKKRVLYILSLKTMPLTNLHVHVNDIKWDFEKLWA